jgi:hypothetical protein
MAKKKTAKPTTGDGPRYVATRQCTSGHALATDGVIHAGEEFPAEEVNHSLLTLGWVRLATPDDHLRGRV